jgi:hypothetical protein
MARVLVRSLAAFALAAAWGLAGLPQAEAAARSAPEVSVMPGGAPAAARRAMHGRHVGQKRRLAAPGRPAPIRSAPLKWAASDVSHMLYLGVGY